MQELGVTPSTLILLAIVIACAVLAIRRLRKRGLCDCNDRCSGCSECPSCKAAESMVVHMDHSKWSPLHPLSGVSLGHGQDLNIKRGLPGSHRHAGR